MLGETEIRRGLGKAIKATAVPGCSQVWAKKNDEYYMKKKGKILEINDSMPPKHEEQTSNYIINGTLRTRRAKQDKMTVRPERKSENP